MCRENRRSYGRKFSANMVRTLLESPKNCFVMLLNKSDSHKNNADSLEKKAELVSSYITIFQYTCTCMAVHGRQKKLSSSQNYEECRKCITYRNEIEHEAEQRHCINTEP